ncbi:MAG: hypothetical protein BAJALOKI1v1_1340011 [Promethearchaeota archaeon]|nr:MAG: hypothetical protein BAJALOKI1v1_1340011 [Candidatus Lokiarchaeota archaeon]
MLDFYDTKCIILKRKKGPLSFSNISERFKKDTSYITTHIKKLELSGIIQNFIKKSDERREYCFYEIRDYGNKILSDFLTNYAKYYNIKLSTFKSFRKQTKDDLNHFLKGIKSKFRFVIVIYLKEYGECSFTDIKMITKNLKQLLRNI